MLVEVGAREGHAAAAGPGLTLVGRGVDIRHTDRVEVAVVVAESRHVREVAVPGADAIAGPERDRQEPVAVGEDRRLIERAAIGDTDGGRPGRIRIVRIIAAGDPIAAPSVEVAEALVEEAPEAALGVRPKVADERAAVRFARQVGRVDDQTRLGPRFARVIGGSQHEEAVGAVAVTDPGGPEASLRRAVEADDHVARPIGVGVFRPWVRVEHRRLEGEVERRLIKRGKAQAGTQQQEEGAVHKIVRPYP